MSRYELFGGRPSADTGIVEARQSAATSASWDRIIDVLNAEVQPHSRALNVKTGDEIDPEDRLPPKAKARFLSWQDARAAAHGALLTASDEERELRTEIQRIQNMWAGQQAITRGSRDGRPGVDQDAAQKMHDKVVAGLERQLKRAVDARVRREQVFNETGRTHQAAHDAMKEFPAHASIIDFEAKPEKGATLDSLRAKIAGIKTEARATLTAPLPKAHALARARQYVDDLAARGAPNVSGLIDRDRDIVWPAEAVDVNWFSTSILSLDGGLVGMPKGRSYTKIHSTPAILAWLFKPQMQAAIAAEIEANADDATALTPQQQAAKVADLDRTLLLTEHAECRLAEATGEPYRADANPLALLGVEIVGA